MLATFQQFLLALLFAATLSSCAVNPVTGQQNFVMLSESQEKAMGRDADAQVRKQYGVYRDPKLQSYVDEVGQKLARNSDRPNLQYHFTVLDSPIINAFALPGGYVYITRGILPYLGSEADLAAVLGHEIGHVAARHSVQQYTAAMAANIGVQIASIFVPEINTQVGNQLVNILGGALLSGYGREHELEADRLGSKYLARTDYDPHAMIDVLSVLKNQELFDAELAKKEGRQPQAYHGVFASHPDNDTRLQQVVGAADADLPRNHPIVNREIYLAHLDGITYGDDAAQGVIRGNRFLHSDLGFAIDFPPDWKIQNRPDKLIATSPDRVSSIELTLDEKFDGSPEEYIQRKLGNPLGEARPASIHGLPAAVLVSSESGKPFEAAAIRMGLKLFFIGCSGNATSFERDRQKMHDAIISFHHLNPEEDRLAEGLKIALHTAKAGESFSGYAKDSPLGVNAEARLRLLNEDYPKGEPVPGQTIKLVR